MKATRIGLGKEMAENLMIGLKGLFTNFQAHYLSLRGLHGKLMKFF